ncbi:hypothetical protein [Sphingobacterium sp. BS-2]|uniref:hypothetical protein n=1 Tax=Sphingobacterium sp. BS-2 TaxID=3377129 RepID=UPI0038FC748E
MNQDSRDPWIDPDLGENQDALRRRSGDRIGGWAKIKSKFTNMVVGVLHTPAAYFE